MKKIISPKNYLMLLIPLALMLLVASCKDEDDQLCNDPRNKNCPNYNPCIDVKPVSAAFTMVEESGFLRRDLLWTYYDTDTSVYNEVRFTALEQNALSYKWFIGTELEPRYGQSITINFTESRTPKRIRLIVEKAPNKNCYPNDDGIDTLDRMLYFINRYDTVSMPMYGKFRGVSTENLLQPKDIEIGLFTHPSTGNYVTFAGLNDCVAHTSSGNLGFRLYTPWKVNMRVYDPNTGLDKPRCNLFDVIVRLPDNTDSIYLQYKKWGRDSTLHEFKGVKMK